MKRRNRTSKPDVGTRGLDLYDPQRLGDDEVLVVAISRRGRLTRTVALRDGPVGERELELSLAGAQFALAQITPLRAKEPEAQLTAAEDAILQAGGFTRASPDRVSAFDLSRLEYAQLLEQSLTADQAARLLRVNSSRVRQRLIARRLYGIKDGSAWKLPRFQFLRTRLVPGVDRVLPRLRDDLHPLGVVRWFTTPSTELLSEDESISYSPLEWLSAGHSPDPVAELAAEL